MFYKLEESLKAGHDYFSKDIENSHITWIESDEEYYAQANGNYLQTPNLPEAMAFYLMQIGEVA